MSNSSTLASPHAQETPVTGVGMDTAKAAAKGTSISLVGSISYKLLTFVLAAVVARGLGAGPYGIFNFGLATVLLARFVALLALDRGAVQYIARFRTLKQKHNEWQLARRLTLLVAGWSILVGLGLFLLAGRLTASQAEDSAAMAAVVRWFAPAVPLSALLYLLTSIADGQRRITLGVVTRDILQPGAAVVFAAIVLWVLQGTVLGVVQAFLLSMIIALAVTFYFLRNYYIPGRKPAAPPTEAGFSMREVINFSIPVFPARLLKEVGNRLEIFLLGYLATSEAVGLFSASANIAFLVIFGLQAVLRIYSTLAAEFFAQNDLHQVEQTQHLATRWATTFSLPALIAAWLLGPDILRLFGDRFADQGMVLLILALGQFINAATGPVSVTLHMAGFSRLLLFNSLTAVAANVGLGWWLIGQMGVMGAAIAGATVMAVMNLIAVIELQWLVGIRSFGRGLLRPLAAGLATLAVVWPAVTLMTSAPHLVRLVGGLGLIGLTFTLAYWFVAPPEDKKLFQLAWARARQFLKRRPGYVKT